MRTEHALLLACLLLAGCPKPPPPPLPSRPVAVVDGQPIHASDLRRELWRVHGKPVAGDVNRLPLARALLDHMVDQELLMQAAKKAGVTADERELETAWLSTQDGYRINDFNASLVAQGLTPERVKEDLRARITVEKFLKSQAKQQARPSDEDVKAYYEAHKANYRVPEQVRARQVVVRTEEEARPLQLRLAKGENFERIAREHSVAPEKVRGGDLGFFAKGVMPEVFDKVCFSLEPGQVSDVVPSEYGQHIFQVTERRAEMEQPLGAVADDIRDLLRRQAVENAETRLLAALHEKAVLEYFPEVLAWTADALVDGGA